MGGEGERERLRNVFFQLNKCQKKMDVENSSMHEMSVGDKKEKWKCSSVLPVLHVDMSLCSVCDGERRNRFTQENCAIPFNCPVSSFSAAQSFRRLSLWCFGCKTVLSELFPWRTLKISEIVSFT